MRIFGLQPTQSVHKHEQTCFIVQDGLGLSVPCVTFKFLSSIMILSAYMFFSLVINDREKTYRMTLNNNKKKVCIE